METPWEVIGFERVTSQSGNPGVRLYCQRPVAGDGTGMEAGRFYYNPEKVPYDPQLQQKLILIMDGNFVQRIILVG